MVHNGPCEFSLTEMEECQCDLQASPPGLGTGPLVEVIPS